MTSSWSDNGAQPVRCPQGLVQAFRDSRELGPPRSATDPTNQALSRYAALGVSQLQLKERGCIVKCESVIGALSFPSFADDQTRYELMGGEASSAPHEGNDQSFASLCALVDPSLLDGRSVLRVNGYKFTVRVNRNMHFDAQYQPIPSNNAPISPADQRLEPVERRFQERSRSGRTPSPSVAMPNENACRTGVLT